MSAQHILGLNSWGKGCNVNCEQGPCDRVARKASFDSLATPFAWIGGHEYVLEPHNTNNYMLMVVDKRLTPSPLTTSMDHPYGLP